MAGGTTSGRALVPAAIAGLCDLWEARQRPHDHGGAGSVERAAASAARGRTDQQGDDAEAGLHVPSVADAVTFWPNRWLSRPAGAASAAYRRR